MLHNILVNYLLPLVIYGSVTGLANLLLAHRSQIEAWSESNPKYAGFLKLLRAFGFDPWNVVAAVSLWAKKKLPDAQQNGAKAVTALLVAQGNNAVATPPERMFPSVIPPVAALLLAVCFAFHATACASFRPSPKTIADVARDLCSVAFAERHAAMSPTDIAKDFCATEKQLDPFVQQLLAAKRAALAPPEEAKKAPVLTGCDAAIENSKRLGCTFEATDAGGWCSTLKSAQVSCAATATNCLATRKCTEAAK